MNNISTGPNIETVLVRSLNAFVNIYGRVIGRIAFSFQFTCASMALIGLVIFRKNPGAGMYSVAKLAFILFIIKASVTFFSPRFDNIPVAGRSSVAEAGSLSEYILFSVQGRGYRIGQTFTELINPFPSEPASIITLCLFYIVLVRTARFMFRDVTVPADGRPKLSNSGTSILSDLQTRLKVDQNFIKLILEPFILTICGAGLCYFDNLAGTFLILAGISLFIRERAIFRYREVVEDHLKERKRNDVY